MTTRSEDMGTFQMLWDCGYCGTDKLLGLDHRHCPGCGSPQDAERRYFPSDAEKVAVADHRYTGADRICGACETPMAAAAEFCGGCGAPMTEAAAARTRTDPDGPVPDPATPSPAQPGGRGRRFGAGIALLVLVAVAAAVAMLWTKDAQVTVSGHAWERTITVENLESVRDSDWKEDVPSDATEVSCHEEERGSKKVADGETCKTRKKDQGDGTFKEVKECETRYRSEPTLDQMCDYRVQRWTDGKTHRATGTSRDRVKWPSVRISGGKQREGRKTETYTLRLAEVSGGATHDCDVPLKTWKQLDAGDTVTAKKRAVTGGLDCGSVR